MAQTLSMVSLITMIAAILCLVASVIVFFVFKIPAVIGDLSGKTARKSIEQMRKEKEQKVYKINKKSRKEKVDTSEMSTDRPDTGLLMNDMMTPVHFEKTAVLNKGKEERDTTTVLRENKKVVLKRPSTVTIIMIDEMILTDTDEVIR